MSEEENVREQYRPLTEREREILELLLSVEAEGMEELREQIPHAVGARWNCGCASFDLVVDQAKAPRSTITKSPLSEAASKEQGNPDRYYELLLWVKDGWLSGVEIVDYVERHGEQSPQKIPPLDYWETPRFVNVAQPPT